MNLRHLLALPVAFATAWVLVYPFTVRLISYRWATTWTHVNSVVSDIEYRFIPDRRLTVDAVQRWIEGKAIYSDPQVLHGSPPMQADPWGKPLQVVERLDDDGRKRFAAYSFGRDGISDTDGNDPDDINSWSDNPVAYYQREAKRDSQIYRLQRAIPLGCILYAPMFFLLRTKKKTEPSVARELPKSRF